MTARQARRLLRRYRALYQAGRILDVDDVRLVMRAALLLLPSKTLMPFRDYITAYRGDVRYCPKGLLAAVLGLAEYVDRQPVANYYRMRQMSGQALTLMDTLEQIAMSAARDAGDDLRCVGGGPEISGRPSHAAYDAVVAALGMV